VAYGPAFASSQDGCPNFYANKAHTVIVSVTLANGQASAISVLGPKFWNTSRTMASCLAYLPGDAVAVKGALSLPTYHSNIGEVVIFNDGPGSCTISLAS
jgi:hypothetical protein